MKTVALLPICLLFALSSFGQSCIDCSLIAPGSVCPTVVDPVCGCNGVTYSNSCFAEITDGITSYEAGICPSYEGFACSDLTDVDFGECDMVLGWGIINGEAVVVSGCSTISSDSVDYTNSLFSDPGFIEFNCLCSGVNGVVEMEDLKLSLSISQSQEFIQIFFDSAEILEMTILDISGRLVSDLGVISSGQTINIHALKAGAYILVATTDYGRTGQSVFLLE